jgi:hypothetical protein
MLSQKGSLNILGSTILISIFIVSAFFFVRNYKTPQLSQPAPTLQNKPQPTTSQMGLKFDFPESLSDPFNDKNGPFNHKVYIAKSPDGLSFKDNELLFNKASNPDIVKLPEGRLFAYMVDVAGRSKSGVIVALSDDNGVSWDKGSIQLKNKSENKSYIADPNILYTKSGNFRLYYIIFKEGNNEVLSAISSDGINFTEEDGVRFKYPYITDPDIIFVNDKYFMYLSQGQKLISTSSEDGLNFKLEKTIRQNGSVSKTVYVDVDFYRQFYCFEGKIKSAKTSDGLNFQDEPGFRLEPENGKIICDPAPVHLGGSWLMLYKQTN